MSRPEVRAAIPRALSSLVDASSSSGIPSGIPAGTPAGDAMAASTGDDGRVDDWIRRHGPMLEQHPLPTAVVDDAGVTRLLNAAARRLFELSPERPLPSLLDHVDPDEMDRVLCLRRDYLERRPDVLHSTLRWRSRLGRTLMLRMTVTRMALTPSSVETARGTGDAVLHVLGFEDQTRLHALEIQRRDHVAGAAVNELAARSAHDLLSRLSTIHTLTHECRRYPTELPAHLEAIEEACHVAAGISLHLLTFSQRRAVRTRSLDLTTHVQEVLDQLQPLIGPHHRLQFDTKSVPLVVLGDEMLLEQVVVNLVAGALHASPGGGRIVVSLHERHVSERASPIPARREICLRVIDEGVYHDDLVMAAMEGTTAPPALRVRAQGIVIVQRVIEGMDGAVAIGPAPDRGTIVEVRIPLAASPREDGTIVALVDADAFRRATMRHLLAELGYDVVESASFDEARLRMHQTRRPHLLLQAESRLAAMTGEETRERMVGLPVGSYMFEPAAPAAEEMPVEPILIIPALVDARADALRHFVEHLLRRADAHGHGHDPGHAHRTRYGYGHTA